VIVRDLFHGFDSLPGLAGTPQQRLVVLAGAIDWILTHQQEAAAQETTPDCKKRAHRRYNDAVQTVLQQAEVLSERWAA
jgi:type I restriction enzyme R subunit